MKKTLITTLALGIGISPVLGHASDAKAAEQHVIQQNDEASTNDQQQVNNEVIEKIEPYVQKNEDGTLGLKDVPQDIYDTYDLQGLEEHFNQINEGVKNHTLAVDENLEIHKTGFSTMASTYGSWTYHWWGYDRKFNNSQTKQYIDQLEYAALGATFATGVGAWFPPVAAIGGVSAAYWGLLAKRVDANNKGKGVYVGVTWVNAFNVKPL
jgi:hypothetical protein